MPLRLADWLTCSKIEQFCHNFLVPKEHGIMKNSVPFSGNFAISIAILLYMFLSPHILGSQDAIKKLGIFFLDAV